MEKTEAEVQAYVKKNLRKSKKPIEEILLKQKTSTIALVKTREFLGNFSQCKKSFCIIKGKDGVVGFFTPIDYLDI